MSKLIFVIASIIAAKAFAIQDFETVVTDQRFNSSSSIVIDKKEIEKSRAKNLTSLLASQANLSIAQSNFQPNSIYLRGGDSSHILILVDGVAFYDATTVQRTFNLNSLDLKSIQKIEVIKGSQSVLFGGQALSGVIKITTIPDELKDTGYANVQVGMRDFRSLAAGILKKIGDDQAVVARGSVSDRKNPSPVEGSSKVYPTRLGTADLSYIYKTSAVETIIKAQTLFDKTFIASSDPVTYKAVDADNFETSNYQVGVTGTATLKNNYVEPTLSLSRQRSARIYEQNAIDGGYPTKQDFVGDISSARLELSPVNEKEVKLRVGGSYTEEKFIYNDADVLQADQKENFQGAFVKADVSLDPNLQLEAGTRADYKSSKNQILTYQAGVTVFKNVKAEYSTGFKQPSLYQLFSAYGNKDLQPEKSTSASISVEGNVNPDLFLSITFFQSEFTNLIVYSGAPPAGKYENISKSKTIGAEGSAGLRIPEQQLFINLAVGYQEPRDVNAANWLLRRPLRTASLKVRKEFDQYSFGGEVVHNGDRRDRMGSTTYGTLGAYTYTNLIAEYVPQENLSFFARGQNIFNQKYQSSQGFTDEGLNVTGGAEVHF